MPARSPARTPVPPPIAAPAAACVPGSAPAPGSASAPGRRALLGAGLLAGALAALPRGGRAQGEGPIPLGALVPLSGAGGAYGPSMAKAMGAVIDEVNAAGGIGGRRIALTVLDDQSNPDAGVRAARQLIEVTKVAAIMGTWASAVTMAVAPLCWGSRTFLTTVSGADSITKLPTDGYLIRTQPDTTLQGTKFGQFALSLGAKKVFFMSPQTPFFDSEYAAIQAAVKAGGGETGSLVYDDGRPSYRGEVDAMMRAAPDALVLGGYTPDTTVLLKDLYRAGYKGKKIAFAYSVNQKLVDAVPAAAVDGCYTIAPSSAEGSPSWADMVKLLGVQNPDPYTTQAYDQASLVILAMAFCGNPTGEGIKGAIRSVSQAPGGKVVNTVTEGLKLIAAKTPIAYEGASGPCKFTPSGNITDASFRYEQVQNGKIVLLKVG